MIIKEFFSTLIYKLSQRNKYSFYFSNSGDYFYLSDGVSIVCINYDAMFGITSSLCYIPNKEHGSCMRISKLKDNDYDSFINDIEHFILLQKNNPADLQYLLNRYKIKNKKNVKFYNNVESWRNKLNNISLIEAYQVESLNKLKRGINNESICNVIVYNGKESICINDCFYQGLEDIEKVVSTVIFNRNLKEFFSNDLKLTIIQKNKYITNLKIDYIL